MKEREKNLKRKCWLHYKAKHICSLSTVCVCACERLVWHGMRLFIIQIFIDALFIKIDTCVNFVALFLVLTMWFSLLLLLLMLLLLFSFVLVLRHVSLKTKTLWFSLYLFTK